MKTKAIKSCAILLIMAIFGTSTAFGQDDGSGKNLAQSLPDGTWLSLNGTVASVSADRFEMNYGDRTVTVEMDDGDRDADAYKLLEGDGVIVTGYVDDDLFETATIEATSVHVKNIGTTFYASALDDEDVVLSFDTPVYSESSFVRGTVTSVDRIENEFTIDDGLRRITVDVSPLDYDPLDDDGYQKVGVGDYVSVSGHYEPDLFEGQVLDAEALVILRD